MAGNARFHNKWHRRGHHSIVSEGYPDSATDPIASPDEPFIGPFVLRDSLSAGGDVTFRSNLFIHGDATILGSLTALGDTTVLETRVTATSALSVINHGSEPALTVIQYGDNPVARFIADDGVAFVIEDNGNIGINTSNLEPGVGLTIGTTLSSSYPLSANASHGTFHNFAGSVSEGNSKALGDFAHAEGTASYAYGTGSHAEGANNTANNIASHVEGISNVTNADAAHAEGGNNTASGYAAHAEGSYNTASGNSSHAEGYNNQATGIASHAHGTGNIVRAPAGSAQGSNNLIEASADNSSAIGVSNTINGINSLAQGENNLIDDTVRNGIAIGKNNHIRGDNSVAIGRNNRTMGEESIALGIGARAGHDKSIVYSATDSNNYQSNSFGEHTFNVFASSGIVLYDSTTIGDPASATFFAITTAGFVGIGTEDPYDMLTVAGNISAQGVLSAFANTDRWHQIGGSLYGGLITQRPIDNNTLVWNTHPGKKFGSTADNQIALNTEWVVISSKRIELDWDVNIVATGQTPDKLNTFTRLSASQLYGTNNYAGGRYGTLTGRHNLVDGDDNIVCGNENTVRGTYNSVIGDHSLAVGKNNVAVLNQSHVEGMNNIVGAPRTITSWTTAANTFYIAGTIFTGLSINFPRENQKIYIHNRSTSRTTNLSRTSFTVLTAFPSQRAIVTVESLSALGFDNPTGDATSGINQCHFIALPTGTSSSSSNVVAAHAEGLQNLASNTGAHAEGYNNMSLGIASHTEGINTIAGNIASHAEGVSTKSGIYIAHISAFDFNARTFYFDNSSPLSASFTPHELWNIVLPGSLIYINDGINTSTTTGRKGYTTVVVLSSDPELATITTVSAVNLSFTGVLPNHNVFAYTNGASYTNARGAFTVAGGTYSEACGYNSYALGANSIAQGYRSIAAHNNTYVWADGTNQGSGIPVKSTRTDQFVVSAGGGVYFPGNVGIGTDANNEALTVTGNIAVVNGNIAVDGKLTVDGNSILGNASTDRTTIVGIISGNNPTTSFNAGSATGSKSFAANEGKAFGDRSFAEGNSNAWGVFSHAEGNNTLATGLYAHAEGDNTRCFGDYGAHAEGYVTTAIGTASHAEGLRTDARGEVSHAAGVRVTAGQNYTYAWSDGNLNTLTSNVSTTRTGQYMVSASGGMFIPGNLGIGTDNNSNALTVNGNISASGDLFVDNNTILGNASTDQATINAFAVANASRSFTIGANTFTIGMSSTEAIASNKNLFVFDDVNFPSQPFRTVFSDGGNFRTVTDSTMILGTNSDQHLRFRAGGSTSNEIRMTILSSGEVGIGTSIAQTRSPVVSAINGNFQNTTGLTPHDANWYYGTPSGWTSPLSPAFYTVYNAGGGDLVVNPSGLATGPGNLSFRQNLGPLQATSDIRVTFDYASILIAPWSSGSLLVAIYDGSFNVLAQNVYTTAGTYSLNAVAVPVGTTIIVGFWAIAGTPGINNVTVTQIDKNNLTVVGSISASGNVSAKNVSLRSANVITPITVTDSGEFLILNINGTNKAIRLWDYTT